MQNSLVGGIQNNSEWKLILNFARINVIIINPDVRWNNIGPLGGQKFLDLLQSSNSNLTKLELQGNHIGKEQLVAVGKKEELQKHH